LSFLSFFFFLFFYFFKEKPAALRPPVSYSKIAASVSAG